MHTSQPAENKSSKLDLQGSLTFIRGLTEKLVSPSSESDAGPITHRTLPQFTHQGSSPFKTFVSDRYAAIKRQSAPSTLEKKLSSLSEKTEELEEAKDNDSTYKTLPLMKSFQASPTKCLSQKNSGKSQD